jgi:hypothetical protein
MLLSQTVMIALLASGATRDQLPSCKVSVYAINSKGLRSPKPILLPEHFASISFAGPGVVGGKSWRFVLTPKGKALNSSYTKAHQGEKVAFFCGSRELLRPTIAGASSGEFAIESP